MNRPEGSGMRTWTRKPVPIEPTSRREDVCEIIRALMDGPKTQSELCAVVNFSTATVNDWLRAMRQSGIVRISARLPRKLYVYSLQQRPFAMPDAPHRDKRSSRADSIAANQVVAR